MNEKVKQFLDSDILENYLVGDASREEKRKAANYIALYPEVREAYNTLQDHLETFSGRYAKKTPEGLKQIVLHNATKKKARSQKILRYTAAASVALMLFAGFSYFFWNQHKKLQQKNTLVTNQIKYLEENLKDQLEDVRNQFIVLNNPATKKYTVRGKKEGKALKAIAYINPVKKLSYINVSNVPALPDNKCFQMWAEVNGELVNLGIIKPLKDKDKLLALPYADNAIGYITVEPEGGNTFPSVEHIVANITY